MARRLRGEAYPVSTPPAPHLDPLTGLVDHAGFDARLAAEWCALNRSHHRLSLLLVEVDHFKAYNDGYGPLAGDECLRRVAGCLAAAVTDPAQVPSRLGGPQFAMILPGSSPETARQVAERVRAGLAAAAVPHRFATLGRVSVSVGTATRWPDPSPNADQLVGDADVALSTAKAAGRDRVECLDGGMLCT